MCCAWSVHPGAPAAGGGCRPEGSGLARFMPLPPSFLPQAFRASTATKQVGRGPQGAGRLHPDPQAAKISLERKATVKTRGIGRQRGTHNWPQELVTNSAHPRGPSRAPNPIAGPPSQAPRLPHPSARRVAPAPGPRCKSSAAKKGRRAGTSGESPPGPGLHPYGELGLSLENARECPG